MDRQPRARTLSDPEFGRSLTLAQAYRLMFQFIEQYHARGESSTLALLGDLSRDVRGDGGSGDPAQLEDVLAVAQQVLEDPGHAA